MRRVHRILTLCGASLTLSVACAAPQAPKPAGEAPPKSAPSGTGLAVLAPATEPRLPALRTGAIAPVMHREDVELKVLARELGARFETAKLELPAFAAEQPGDQFWDGAEVRINAAHTPFAFVGRAMPEGRLVIWIRRTKESAGLPLSGDIYTPARGARPGHHFRFRVAASSTGTPAAAKSKLERDWALELFSELSRRRGAFYGFAGSRLKARFAPDSAPAPTIAPGEWAAAPSHLSILMNTTTGRSVLQAALEHDRRLLIASAKKPRTIAVGTIQGPRLTRHPWAEMQRGLSQPAPDEALARAVPADFYYVQAREFAGFLELADVLESFGKPAADALDGHAEDRGTFARYEAELGLERTELTRVLGPKVIDSLALTGSDPYVHDGSDLTLIFKLKSSALFHAALAKAMVSHAAAHGGTQQTTFSHEGIKVTVTRSSDGRIRQHHAEVADFDLISNSPAAIKRVISAALGKAPRLSDELDFRYMMARDAGKPDAILAFGGDRFVETVIGPAQKIAAARRQIAYAELRTPGYATLLHGWITGQSPKTTQELIASGLLQRDELRHGTGGAIEFQPGTGARSSFGTTTALEPLIDGPQVTHVSQIESEAYRVFANTYEGAWAEYVDPFALRIARVQGGTLSAELRVLPVMPVQHRELLGIVGNARVTTPPIDAGFRAVLALGKDAPVRQELTRFAGGFIGSSRFTFDWLGDWAEVGIADRNELPLALRKLGEVAPERPATDEELSRDPPVDDMAALRIVPAYARIAIRNRAAAALAITALRAMAMDSAPDVFSWKESGSHRGISIVEVVSREREHRDDLHIYYAICPDALIVSLNSAVLEALIDQLLDGKAPKNLGNAAKASSSDRQLVIDLASRGQGGMRTTLGWLLTQAALENDDKSRDLAEAVLRGAPEIVGAERSSELARTYFGSVPLTPDGKLYDLSPSGIRDPLRGTPHAPIWPDVPAPDSPVARLLARFASYQGGLSFDVEPSAADQQQRLSLRANVTLGLR